MPYGGRYEHFTYPYGISLSVGELDFRSDPTNTNFLIEIANNYPYADGYGVVSYGNCSLPNAAAVNNIAWGLRDDSGTAISSIQLPATAPVLNDWQVNFLSIGGGPDREGFTFSGHVTSAFVIPEPTTILFLGFAGGALLGRNK